MENCLSYILIVILLTCLYIYISDRKSVEGLCLCSGAQLPGDEIITDYQHNYGQCKFTAV